MYSIDDSLDQLEICDIIIQPCTKLGSIDVC